MENRTFFIWIRYALYNSVELEIHSVELDHLYFQHTKSVFKCRNCAQNKKKRLHMRFLYIVFWCNLGINGSLFLYSMYYYSDPKQWPYRVVLAETRRYSFTSTCKYFWFTSPLVEHPWVLESSSPLRVCQYFLFHIKKEDLFFTKCHVP